MVRHSDKSEETIESYNHSNLQGGNFRKNVKPATKEAKDPTKFSWPNSTAVLVIQSIII